MLSVWKLCRNVADPYVGKFPESWLVLFNELRNDSGRINKISMKMNTNASMGVVQMFPIDSKYEYPFMLGISGELDSHGETILCNRSVNDLLYDHI